MEVILLERVEKLGAIGDVVTVKNGFARNFLLPRNKALRANEANRKLFEANKAKIVADNEVKRTEAEAASKGIDGVSVTLIRQASNTGQLYGSVAVRDIVEALVADGKKVGKQQISVDVSSVIRASPTSFRVAWIERRYQDGALAETSRWTAILTIVVQPPRTAEKLRANPLGIYVNAINWSRELGQ